MHFVNCKITVNVINSSQQDPAERATCVPVVILVACEYLLDTAYLSKHICTLLRSHRRIAEAEAVAVLARKSAPVD